jgi:hypothetical protein
LYLAAIGPNDGDGITVGNFSALTGLGLPQLPAIGGIPLADSTTSYFAVLDEAALNYDLDKNGSISAPFYMLAFDSDFNGKQNLTSALIDDDLELLPWSVRIGEIEIQYDFTQNESYAYGNRTREQWGNLPSGIWTGNVRFGDDYSNVYNWDEQPSWDVPFYNNTNMIIRKSEWRVNPNKPVDVLLKIYNFNQNPIQGANVSVTKVARSSWMGFQVLSPSNYTVDKTYNVTDSYGYSFLKITPVGTWSSGQYQVLVNIQAPQGTETLERWFCVGGCNQ